MPPVKSIPYKFILLASLFFITDFVIENINHRFLLGDFKVYYEAANAIIGGKQVYGALFSLSIGYYKYSPFMALVFYPLSILPYYAACVIDFLLVCAATVFTSITLLHIFSTYAFRQPVKSPNLIMSLALLCISTHLERELGLGNVNVILLLLLSLSLLFILQKRMVLAGVLLALVIITKPFFILLVIPLLLRRYFKTLLITGVTLVLCIVFPALILGIGRDIDLHKQWISTMLLHADSFPAPNTIDSMIRYYFSSDVYVNLQYIILACLLIPYAVFSFLNKPKNRNPSPAALVMEWFAFIAIMPSLFKTDTEHFLLALPIILFILTYLFSNKKILLAISFIALIILYAGNSSDLLGKNISLLLYHWGVLGISNLLLIAMALFIYFKYTRSQKAIL